MMSRGVLLDKGLLRRIESVEIIASTEITFADWKRPIETAVPCAEFDFRNGASEVYEMCCDFGCLEPRKCLGNTDSEV